jgi:hypothetical protein
VFDISFVVWQTSCAMPSILLEMPVDATYSVACGLRPNVAWSLISRPMMAAMKDPGLGRHDSSIEMVVLSDYRESVGVQVLKLCVSLGALWWAEVEQHEVDIKAPDTV